jgi:CrcB protein
MVRAGHMFGLGFPMGTLIVNIAGAFIFGALIEVMALKWSPGEDMRAFLVVGVLGSFTTFSTFSLDVVTMIERGNYMFVAIYVAVSVVAAVAALFGGMALFRWVLV